jgi:hypothetical protein
MSVFMGCRQSSGVRLRFAPGDNDRQAAGDKTAFDHDPEPFCPACSYSSAGHTGEKGVRQRGTCRTPPTSPVPPFAIRRSAKPRYRAAFPSSVRSLGSSLSISGSAPDFGVLLSMMDTQSRRRSCASKKKEMRNRPIVAASVVFTEVSGVWRGLACAPRLSD